MISDPTDMITPHPSVVALMQRHALGVGIVHDDLQASTCACRKRAASEGQVCASCGGLMVRTGTCHTCTQCGTTGGCG